MPWTKVVHQSANSQTFDCSGKISPNLYFDRLLFLKVYKMSVRKVQRSLISCHGSVVQNLKKNRFVVSKMTRIWSTLIQAVNSQKCALYLVSLVQSI